MQKTLKRVLYAGVAAAGLIGLGACSDQGGGQQDAAATGDEAALQKALAVSVTAETTPSVTDSASTAVILNLGGQTVIAGAVEDGLELYGADGIRFAAAGEGEIEAVTNVGDFVLAVDGSAGRLVGFKPDAKGGLVVSGSVPLGGMVEGLCAYKSAFDGNSYVFLLGSNGDVRQHQLITADDGSFEAPYVRGLRTGTEPKFCTVDAYSNSLYVAEESVGIWRYDAHVEAEVIPELIDVVKFGHVSEEVGGLAVYRRADGSAVLLASDVASDSLNAFDINDDHRWLGAVTLSGTHSGGSTVDAVEAIDGVAVSTASGLMVVADNDNGEEATNFKLVALPALDAALGALAPATPQPVTFQFARVSASVETDPVDVGGDAADDPAVWVHPEDPARSLIIGTNKQGNLNTYTLDGSLKQSLPDGKVNNVDIRYNVKLGDAEATVVAASNRTHDSISFYSVNEMTGDLINASAAHVETGMDDPYGLCMYQSAKTGKTYVFMNEKDGLVQQWEITGTDALNISASKVREFTVGSTAEGCAADDDTGLLFVAEEDVALWRYQAEPDMGNDRIKIAGPDTHAALKDDLEGVSVYYGDAGAGYLIVSSQGNNSYAVFDRKAPHPYIGSYLVVAGETGIDGSSETDGLDVISTPLGPKFPYGVFIAQDGRNIVPDENQNFKLVPWEHIADGLKLHKTQSWSPRD